MADEFRDLRKLQLSQYEAWEKRQNVIDRVLLKNYKQAYQATVNQIATLYAKVGLDDPVGGFFIRKEDAIRYNQLANRLANIEKELKKLERAGVRLTEENSAQSVQDGYYRNTWAYNQAVGINLSIPALPVQAIRASVYSDASGLDLVQTWNKNTTDQIYKTRAAITRGITLGHSYTKVARSIKAEFDKGLSQAMRVVRTEAGRNWSEGAEASHLAAEEAGLKVRKRWSAALDSRTRTSHAMLDGEFADDEGLFYIGGEGQPQPRLFSDPAETINCIPETAIPIAYEAQEITKRKYEGLLVCIETSHGNKISITPNHPVLTDKGWIAANKIDVGCNIISVQLIKRFDSSYKNKNYCPPVIAKVFNLFSVKGHVERIPGTNDQFHGDGGNCDIDIAVPDGHLWNGFQSAFYKPIIELNLAPANILTCYLSCLSALQKFLFRTFNTAYRIVSSLRQSHPFIFRSNRHSSKHSFGPVSRIYPITQKHSTETISTDIERFCKSIFGLSCKISFDSVVNVGALPYFGHVYNLQTSNGYYGLLHDNGNMSIVHNCRCSVYDVIDDITPEVRRIRNDSGKGSQILPYQTFQEWAGQRGWTPSGGWPKVKL